MTANIASTYQKLIWERRACALFRDIAKKAGVKNGELLSEIDELKHNLNKKGFTIEESDRFRDLYNAHVRKCRELKKLKIENDKLSLNNSQLKLKLMKYEQAE